MAQNTVDAVPDPHSTRERFEMDVAGSQGCGLLKDVIHQSDDRRSGCSGSQRPVVLRVDVTHRKVVDQLGQLRFVGGTDALGYGGRGRHDRLDAAVRC